MCDFQISHGMKQCTTCQRTNNYDAPNYIRYLPQLKLPHTKILQKFWKHFLFTRSFSNRLCYTLSSRLNSPIDFAIVLFEENGCFNSFELTFKRLIFSLGLELWCFVRRKNLLKESKMANCKKILKILFCFCFFHDNIFFQFQGSNFIGKIRMVRKTIKKNETFDNFYNIPFFKWFQITILKFWSRKSKSRLSPLILLNNYFYLDLGFHDVYFYYILF